MDWSGCEDVVMSAGAPVVRGTDISPDTLIAALKAGKSWAQIAAEHAEVSKQEIENVLQYGVERLAFDDPSLVDWRECLLVERMPGKLHGAPAIVGTRIFADTIATYYWSGASVDEIAEDYPSLSKDTIVQLIRYVQSKEAQAA